MKLTNKLNLPQPFAKAVEREYSYTDKRYSVTQIIKGAKEAILTRRHDAEITQDVSDMIWLIFGTAIHKVLEDAEEGTDELKETKIYIDMPNGYTLSGIQDLYSESLKRVTDYKSGTVWKVIYGDWEDYRMQLLIYVYMLRKIGFPVDNAENVMLLKDWSATKAKTEQNYPPHPVHVQHYDFSEDDFKFVEKYLEVKFNEIERMEKLPDDEIPECTPEERWATPTKYAVMKKGRKTAIKLHDNIADANKMVEDLGHDQHYVEIRKGSDKKCCEYCNCCEFCNYWKEHYGKETV